MNSKSPKIICAGLLVFRRTLSGHTEYLLLQASKTPSKWTPPKGHLDKGEDLMQAAIRETSEESGLEPEDYDIIQNIDSLPSEYIHHSGKLKSVVYWITEIKRPDATIKLSREHINFKWVNAETAIQMTREEFHPVIKQSEEVLNNRKNN